MALRQGPLAPSAPCPWARWKRSADRQRQEEAGWPRAGAPGPPRWAQCLSGDPLARSLSACGASAGQSALGGRDGGAHGSHLGEGTGPNQEPGEWTSRFRESRAAKETERGDVVVEAREARRRNSPVQQARAWRGGRSPREQWPGSPGRSQGPGAAAVGGAGV